MYYSKNFSTGTLFIFEEYNVNFVEVVTELSTLTFKTV